MTRLTAQTIKDVPTNVSKLDEILKNSTGLDVKQLACNAAGITVESFDACGLTVGIVPTTIGQGIIDGFSRSVCTITERLGMKSFVTPATDVVGLSDAIVQGADIIFIADDEKFIALNVSARKFSTNVDSTALGYVTAMKHADGGSLKEKRVLVIGAGRVGSEAVRILSDMGAEVEVTDIMFDKSESLQNMYKGVKARKNVMSAVMDNRLLLNASPGLIPGECIQKGAVISSPGVPYAYDEEGISRAKAIIHDPLEIGVSVMATVSASFSIKRV